MKPLSHLLLLLFAIGAPPGARAENRLLPQRFWPRIWNTVEQAQDCSIYRSLIHRTTQDEQAARQQWTVLEEKIEEKRANVEDCARRKGIELIRDDQDEALAAELCPEAYRDWLESGVQTEIVRQDLEEISKALGLLRAQVQVDCRNPPKPNAVSAGLGQ